MEERRPTNQEHLSLWEDEFYQWATSRPSPRKKLAMLGFLWFVSVVGLVMMCAGVMMLLP